MNSSLKKTIQPTQEPHVRNKNFLEVALGYNEEQAQLEAQRCLNCKHKPCVAGCPVHIDIPSFIGKTAEGKLKEAYAILQKSTTLSSICGRVCPQEQQCEKLCVRGRNGEPVGIGNLERFVADSHAEDSEENKEKIIHNGVKVAIIGSGPSGLTVAGELAERGYDVTIFEALHVSGGVLSYGIPEFRLPKTIVEKEIKKLENKGVKIILNVIIGRSLSLSELMEIENFAALYIATGAGLPKFMNIPGENLKGVYSANEFLTRINLMQAYEKSDTPIQKGKRVAVVGGGNVAMDAARCAKRLGAEEVYIIYRRSEEELPARKEEVEHAKEEEIVFKLLTNPTKIIGRDDNFVSGIECLEMALGEPDSSGRRRPIEKSGSEFIIDVDVVIMAIGTSPNPLIKATTASLTTTSWGGIVADEETGATSIPGVYAGGDAVTGAATVILAMGAGKKAAKAIHEYLQKK